jgi:hypothetical protein
VSPKPEQGQIHFRWGTSVQADEVFLKVYTSGFRIVQDLVFDSKNNIDFLAAGAHEYVWDCKDNVRRPMPPGSYLCFIEIHVGKIKYSASGQTEVP